MPVPTLTLYLRDNCRPCKTTAAYNLIELFYKDKRENRKPKGNTLIGLPYWQLGWEHRFWISISIEGCITLFLSFFRVFFCFFATHLNDSIVAIPKPNHVWVSYSTGEGREGGRTVERSQVRETHLLATMINVLCEGSTTPSTCLVPLAYIPFSFPLSRRPTSCNFNSFWA